MITKTQIDAMKPGETLWDDAVKGFCCRARKTTKTYSVFRSVGGKYHRYTIGKHGDLTVDQARRRAKEIVAKIALGVDPAGQTDKNSTLSVSALCDQFLEQYTVTLKPNTRLDYERQIRLHIKPALGKLAVDQVAHKHIAKLHASMSGTPVVANHVRRVIHKLFEFAKDHELYSGDNPARRVKQYREQPRTTYLSETEIKRLWGVLDAYRHHNVSALLKLLLLTGCRKGELLGLDWRHVDLERGLLNLPDSKTGAKTIILSPDAQDVFRTLSRPQARGLVFLSGEGNTLAHALDWHWRRIKRQAGLESVRLHDLRHTFASILASKGQPLAVVGALMGHRDLKSTQRYAHLYDEALRAGAAAVGAAINGGK